MAGCEQVAAEDSAQCYRTRPISFRAATEDAAKEATLRTIRHSPVVLYKIHYTHYYAAIAIMFFFARIQRHGKLPTVNIKVVP